jgi:mannan endo-1,4-beta-mannosidase
VTRPIASGSFIHDLSTQVRKLELQLYGRAHPQTVSLFGPELWWKPELEMRDPIYRHPDLDFASIHIYREGPIDNPKDTVRPARQMADIVAMSLGEIRDQRPFLDTEHGPIHTFKDKHKTLPAAFDDEYFRHMQWAHLASGGVGGGMRWPNRKPHTLTPGMREAQRGLSEFLAADRLEQLRPALLERAGRRLGWPSGSVRCATMSGAALDRSQPRFGRNGTLAIPLAAPKQFELRCPAGRGASVTLFDRGGPNRRQRRIECPATSCGSSRASRRLPAVHELPEPRHASEGWHPF